MGIPNFDPSDPFPWVAPDQWSYAEEQAHSARADAWLGLRTDEAEAQVRREIIPGPDENLWIGLPVQALQTPYTEIRRMLALLDLKPGSRIVDLGAAYGRMAFVIARHFPHLEFLGFEKAVPRVSEAQRVMISHGLNPRSLRVADLSASDFKLPQANCYFIYDFGSRQAIAKALTDLQTLARCCSLTVVGRGRASRDAIERNHPWLAQVIRPAHFAHYSVYRSA